MAVWAENFLPRGRMSADEEETLGVIREWREGRITKWDNEEHHSTTF
jgi:hypothetical protein